MSRAGPNVGPSKRTLKRRAQRTKLATRTAEEREASLVEAGPATGAVPGTTNSWFERDLQGPAREAVLSSSRPAGELGRARGAVSSRPSWESRPARGAVSHQVSPKSRLGRRATSTKENRDGNRTRGDRCRPSTSNSEVGRGCPLDATRQARRAEREAARKQCRQEEEGKRRAAVRRARDEAQIAAIRQREEEAEWNRRVIAAETRRREAERNRVSTAAPVAVNNRYADSAAPGPSSAWVGYDPNVPGVEAYRLLEKKRSRFGIGDPRRRGPPRNRATPLSLRVPTFVKEGRYTFPPVRFTRPGATPRSLPIVVDCPNSPPFPEPLRAPPSAPLPPPSEVVASASPIAGPSRRPQDPRPSTPATDRVTQPGTPDRPDDDVLLLSAYDTPETFSPPPIEPTPPSKDHTCRRLLRF